jgi:carbonic anhydrase/acetyltransferase-like protein (isoleucine patch superfamily)
MTEIGSLLPHGDKFPELSRFAWVAPGAYVVGDVRLAEESSVWYGAVLRGDTEPIQVGARTNVQDGCILHADPGYPAIVGDECVVGHNAIVHGCEIGGLHSGRRRPRLRGKGVPAPQPHSRCPYEACQRR